MKRLFYNTSGIPLTKTVDGTDLTIHELGLNEFVMSKGDLSIDIEYSCIRLIDACRDKLFERSEYDRLTLKYPWVAQAGIDADVSWSKDEILSEVEGNADVLLNKFLYFHDVSNLIGTLQNAVVETKNIICHFYKELNRNDFMIDEVPQNPNGLNMATGPIAADLHSRVNQLFIILYSQLDFVTKIALELENLRTNFESYPKLYSKEMLYGNRAKVSINKLKGSLWEDNVSNLLKIMIIRNEVVHNGSFDFSPKVYQVFEDGKMVEKFVLLCDFDENGKLVTYKNRRRFFSQEVKLNEILPDMVFDFWERELLSINSIKDLI